MTYTSQLEDLGDRYVEFQELKHLSVPVLVYDVNPFVRGDKVLDFAGERIRPETQVIGLDAIFVLQLVKRFDQCMMRSPVGDNAQVVAIIPDQLRLGNRLPCGLELPP